jgi:hypothetical protein
MLFMPWNYCNTNSPGIAKTAFDGVQKEAPVFKEHC